MEEGKEDIVNQIWRMNQKILGYGEIELFFQLLKKQKPQYKNFEYVRSIMRPRTNHTYQGQKLILSRTTITLRITDDENNIVKLLEIYFLDHFENDNFLEDLNALYLSVKTLLRKDIILQIFDVYPLAIKKTKMYYVIESEEYEQSLKHLYKQQIEDNNLPEDLIIIMKMAINFCLEKSNLKQSVEMERLEFPKDFLKYFFVVNLPNNQFKVKLNALSLDLFESTIFKGADEDDEDKNQEVSKEKKIVKKKEQITLLQLDAQLSNLLLDAKNLSIIPKRELVTRIGENFELLLSYHGKDILEIIAQHPKYVDFQLIEFDQHFFSLGTSINGNNINVKCEKFNSLREVEEMIKLYEHYYSFEDHMFIPVLSFEPIILENSFYLLIEELSLPCVYKFNQSNTKQSSDEYMSLDQILLLRYTINKNRIHQLQVTAQLFKARQMFVRNNIYHGNINFDNVIVKFTAQFTVKLPQIYFSNPLFLRNKQEKEENEKERKSLLDQQQINTAIFIFMVEIETPIMNRLASCQFFLHQDSYFEKLANNKEQIQEKQMEVMEEDDKIFHYLNMLNEYFKILEFVYSNGIPDQYLKINSNWNIEISHYSTYYQTLDQCTHPKLFEMNVQKIIYNFEFKLSPSKIDILRQMQQNSNLVSLNLRGFESKMIHQHLFKLEHTLPILENIVKKNKDLTKLKLEIILRDNKLFNIKYLFDLKNLQQIYLQIWMKINCLDIDKEKGILCVIQHFRDCIELFSIQNTRFKTIDVPPYNNFFEDFKKNNTDWYFENINTTYKQILNNLNFLNKSLTVEDYSQFNKKNITNSIVVEKISRQRNQVKEVQQGINQYFLGLQNVQDAPMSIMAKEDILELILQTIDQYQFITCHVKKDDRNYLVLEFENVLDEEMGKFITKLEYQEKAKLVLISQTCNFQGRFICFHLNPFLNQNDPEDADTFFNINSVKQWILCDYDKKIKENLFGYEYESHCYHCDYIELQKRIYINQTNLQRLTLYLDQCDTVVDQMKKNKDYFGFSQMKPHQIQELFLRVHNLNPIKNHPIYNQLRKQLENAKYLREIQIDRYSRMLKKNLYKLSRLVKITINQDLRIPFRKNL